MNSNQYINLKKISLFFLSVIIFCSCTPLNVEKLNNKAYNLLQTGDIDGAIGRLESINDLDPNYPQTHYNLGMAYYQKDDKGKAIESFEKAISLKKDFANAYFSLAVIYENMAYEKNEKLDEIEANEHKVPNKDEFIAKIISYIDKALANYEEYLLASPKAVDAEEIKLKIKELSNLKEEKQKK